MHWFIIHKSKLIIQLLAASYRDKNPHPIHSPDLFGAIGKLLTGHSGLIPLNG